MQVQRVIKSAEPWVQPKEKVVMSKADALALLKEVQPHVAGHVVGEHPRTERLAKILGVNLGTVS